MTRDFGKNDGASGDENFSSHGVNVNVGVTYRAIGWFGNTLKAQDKRVSGAFPQRTVKSSSMSTLLAVD